MPGAWLAAVAGTLGAGGAAFVFGGAAAAAAVLVLGLLAGSALVLWARGIDRERADLAARLAAAEAACDRAQADNLAKSRFLAEMSHELRTPLNTVMGFSEMMAEEVLGPHRVPAYAGYARDILASGRHLLALADDLLDLARIESGHRVLLETPVHLERLGQECLAMLRPDAAARRLTLRQELVGDQPDAPGGARLWGDERAVRQMALNLLANAVKFTPAGGEVRLVTGLDGAGAPFLAVEDTGAGVSERELPLEDARHRESRLDVTSGRGAGLGLAIVRALAALHGGEFALTRRAGGGTSARVTFPRGRALGTAAAV
ncbi:sensor histidine kinase [Xanthobacter sediminis]